MAAFIYRINIMEIKTANINDFDIAFKFIENLWDYNKYNKRKSKRFIMKL